MAITALAIPADVHRHTEPPSVDATRKAQQHAVPPRVMGRLLVVQLQRDLLEEGRVFIWSGRVRPDDQRRTLTVSRLRPSWVRV